jgi:hypothetical protein
MITHQHEDLVKANCTSATMSFRSGPFGDNFPRDLTHVQASASLRAAFERKTLVKSFIYIATFTKLSVLPNEN